ncbi:MAG: alpha/beta fold hydrolase [Planctomycetota bacterium]
MAAIDRSHISVRNRGWNIHAIARVVRLMGDASQSALHGREARAFALSWSAALLTGCAVPGPQSPRAMINELERASVADNAGAFVSYLRAGEPQAPRIIYVHGSPGDAKAFADDLVDPLPGFESISIDRPGFGEARDRGPVTGFEAQAQAIEPLLVEHDGRWPILVGHSLGGPIIARAAADYPDRVGGLVIVAGSLDPELEELKWFNHLAAAAAVRWLVPRALRVSNDEMFAARAETELLAGVLDRVRCPVVIIHGVNDGLVPYDNVRYTQRMLTNAASIEVVTFKDQGHFVVWQAEGRAAIRDAIRSIAESGGTASGNHPDRSHPQ